MGLYGLKASIEYPSSLKKKKKKKKKKKEKNKLKSHRGLVLKKYSNLVDSNLKLKCPSDTGRLEEISKDEICINQFL